MNITIIGIGRLGLGLALMLSKKNKILGVDINQNYVDSINNKTFISDEPGYNDMLKTDNLKATTSLKEGLEFSDLIFILVQTPNGGGDKFYDHSVLSNLLCEINTYKIKNKNLIINSTVMPGYIDTVAKELVKNNYISYNPEFVAQGDITKGYLYSDIVLLGTENKELENIIEKLYLEFMVTKPKFCFLTPLEAEITKISINGYITTKLSYANMLSDVCDKLNVRKEKVLDSIGSDKRIGNKYFRPGYSFGGPCFPRDTKALQLFLDQNDIESDLLKATTSYNLKHIEVEVERLLELNLDEYIFENVCFKENCSVAIIEESAKLKIAKKLFSKGKKVIIKDNNKVIEEVKKEYGNIFNYQCF